MKKYFAVFFLLFFAKCGFVPPDVGCAQNTYHDYVIKGHFLLNRGERIAFSPKCYYEKNQSRLRCGLAALGVEEYKFFHYSSGDMDCLAIEEAARFNYDSTDFSKVIVVSSNDSSKSIFSYSYTNSKYRYVVGNIRNYVGNDTIIPFGRIKGVDTQQIHLNLIESDSLGIVDFSLKDANGTRIHIKYNLSPFISDVLSNIEISDSGISLSYNENYKILNKYCKIQTVYASGDSGKIDKNVVTNIQLDTCLGLYENSNTEIPIGILPIHPLFPDQAEADLILTCESEPEIKDSVPMAMWKHVVGNYCHSIVIAPYNTSTSPWENFFYKSEP